MGDTPVKEASAATPADKTISEETTMEVVNGSGASNLSIQNKRMLELYASGRDRDVIFVVGPENQERKFPAHKFVLKTVSPVFYNMFREAPLTTQFCIPDTDPINFDFFLKFLYADKLFGGFECVIPLLKLATDYDVPDLAQLCGKLLETGLSEETALTLFKQAVQFQEGGLEASASQFIAKRAYKFIETPGFLELEAIHLCKLFPLDEFAAVSEKQIFEFCIRWAEKNLEEKGVLNVSPKYIRSILEDIIPLIRFPQMSACEFSLVMIKYRELLTTDEAQLVLFYHNIPPSQWSELPRQELNPIPRKYHVRIHKRLIERLDFPSLGKEFRMDTSLLWHRICFKSNADAMLESIGVNGARPGYLCTMEVKLEDEAMEKIFASKSERYLTKADIHHIKFDEPVEILAHTWYTASFYTKDKYVAAGYDYEKSNELKDDDAIHHFFLTQESDGTEVKIEFKDAMASDTTDPNTTWYSGQMPNFVFLMY